MSTGDRPSPLVARAARDRRGQRLRAVGQPPSPLRPTRGNIARPFALVVGIGYVAIGVIGFAVTGGDVIGLRGHGDLLGFNLTIFHNLVHLVIGLAFIGASRASESAITQGILIGGGAVYLVAALLGFLNKLPILAIDSPFAPDNFLHLFSGSAAVLFGLLGTAQQSEAEPPPGIGGESPETDAGPAYG